MSDDPDRDSDSLPGDEPPEDFIREASDLRLDLRGSDGSAESFDASWFCCGRSDVLREAKAMAAKRGADGRQVLALTCPVPASAAAAALRVVHGMQSTVGDVDGVRALDWLNCATWAAVKPAAEGCFERGREEAARLPEAFQRRYLLEMGRYTPLPAWACPQFLLDAGVDAGSEDWAAVLQRWAAFADSRRLTADTAVRCMDFLKAHPARWQLCRPFMTMTAVVQCVATVYRHPTLDLDDDVVCALCGSRDLHRDMLHPCYPDAARQSSNAVVHWRDDGNRAAVVWRWNGAARTRSAAAKFALDLGGQRTVALVGGPRRARKNEDRVAATLKLSSFDGGATVATWRAADGTFGAATSASRPGDTKFDTLPDCLIVTV